MKAESVTFKVTQADATRGKKSSTKAVTIIDGGGSTKRGTAR